MLSIQSGIPLCTSSVHMNCEQMSSDEKWQSFQYKLWSVKYLNAIYLFLNETSWDIFNDKHGQCYQMVFIEFSTSNRTNYQFLSKILDVFVFQIREPMAFFISYILEFVAIFHNANEVIRIVGNKFMNKQFSVLHIKRIIAVYLQK